MLFMIEALLTLTSVHYLSIVYTHLMLPGIEALLILTFYYCLGQ